MNELIGYALAVLVGVSLGLIGGGGSILTVPIITYIFHYSPTAATTYSLFIVGTAAFAGAIKYHRSAQIDIRIAWLFGIPTIVGIYLSRGILIPYLPDIIWQQEGLILTKDLTIMMVFALLMLTASVKMIWGKTPQPTSTTSSVSFWTTSTAGLLVGAITGFVGAGGGFIIVPALMSFFHLPIKKAIGTSLAIITLNSFFGFFSALSYQEIQWTFLLIFSTLSVIGILIGVQLNHAIDGKKLKPAFGFFVLIMGFWILINSTGSVSL